MCCCFPPLYSLVYAFFYPDTYFCKIFIVPVSFVFCIHIMFSITSTYSCLLDRRHSIQTPICEHLSLFSSGQGAPDRLSRILPRGSEVRDSGLFGVGASCSRLRARVLVKLIMDRLEARAQFGQDGLAPRVQLISHHESPQDLRLNSGSRLGSSWFGATQLGSTQLGGST